VYNEYWQSDKAILLYPSNRSTFEEKDFKKINAFEGKTEHHACGLGKISILKEGTDVLVDKIGEIIIDWFSLYFSKLD
jgi:5-methylcytosine-specific restriction enzyme subunit McrC